MTNDDPEHWVEDSGLTVLDRSTLENWANCPAQAALIDSGKVVRESKPMVVGTEVHEAFSHCTREYLHDSQEAYTGVIKDILDQRLAASRPDVQPDVIESVRRSAWSWSKFLCEIHADNILRYDGGRGELSGQLAWDVAWLGVRVTSEVDLLYSGPSPKVVHEVDYKSGHTENSHHTVSKSFQFQLHAMLILENYPEVDAVEISVWDTRRGSPTYPVLFPRENLYQYQGRVLKAVEVWNKHHDMPLNKVPTWPMLEKCEVCPVARLCPRMANVESDPVELLRQLIVVEAARAQLRKSLIASRKEAGQDISTPDGDVFGLDKPKEREATYQIYRAN